MRRGPGARVAWTLALALLVLLSAAVGASAGSGGGSLQVDVTQCSDGSDCTDQSQSVGQQPQTQRIAVPQRAAPKKPAPSAPGEVHEFSLTTGKGTVSADGNHQSETAKLDLAAKPKPAAGEPHTAGAPGPGLPVVHTDGGGSPFSALNPISGDEALMSFRIPPFLLPIYVSAGRAYGVPWNLLASINQIETDFGRIDHQVSSAGALGWMQFMPSTWRRFGVDASGDGIADPYNPVDAIYAAARYLKASGVDTDLRGAILSYNHAGWYADRVLQTANVYGSLPDGLLAETGSLALGRFPVRGRVSYGDDYRRALAAGEPTRGLTINARPGAAVVATQDVTIEKVLLDRDLARALVQPGPAAEPAPAPAPAVPDPAPTAAPPADAPAGPSSPLPLIEVGKVVELFSGRPVALPAARFAAAIVASAPAPAPVPTEAPAAVPTAGPGALPPGYGRSSKRGVTVVTKDALGNRYSYSGLAQLESGIAPGSHVVGGQALGSLPDDQPQLLFAVRAAGGAPVDPRPLVDGYRLQEAADLYHALGPFGANPFVGSGQQPAATGYVFPIPTGVKWTPGRVDMGWDLETGSAGVGRPLLAIGNARILHIQDMGGFGPTWITYRLLDGPAAGKTVFIGHAGPPLVQPGDVVRAGEPIIRIHGGTYGGPPGHFEIGWANADGTNTLAAPHYSEGDLTPEGASFQTFIASVPGSFTDPVFPAGSGALQPKKISDAQERKLAQRLDTIANPQVAVRASAAGVRVAPAADSAPARVTSSLTTEPTAAGARIVDVDVPAGARGDEAYAIGTVDGQVRSQTVVLAHRHGVWKVVGAPRDERGRAVNPRLRDLATVRGGKGYAVGDRGAIVLLRGARAPRLLTASSKAALTTVAATARRGRLSGLAAGAQTSAFALQGSRATPTRTPDGLRPSAIDVAGDRLLAVGRTAGASAPALYQLSAPAHALTRLSLPAGVSARLTSVAGAGQATWVAGGLIAPGRNVTTEVPFAARLESGQWTTFCPAAPLLRAVRELGQRSGGVCDGELPARTGTASAIAATTRGVVVATPQALALYESNNFRPLPAAAIANGARSLEPGWSRLALAQDGHGWAIAAHGRMTRITPVGDKALSALRLSPAGGGKPGRAALAATGGTALLASDRVVADFAGGAWTPAPAPGLGLRALALLRPGVAWGLDGGSGTLLRYSGHRWAAPPARGIAVWAERVLLRALGGRGLSAAGPSDVATGLRALAFAGGQGYAVGDHGVIGRLDGERWRLERSPVTTRLTGVAASSRGVVAVGSHGTLLRRDSQGRWVRVGGAAALVGGRDIGTAGRAGDGTLLAAAGGTIIAAATPAAWHRADVPALGLRVLRLAGYRAADGALHVVALVDQSGQRVVLEGSRTGWRPLSLGGAGAVDDFALDESTSRIWLAGRRAGGFVVDSATAPGRPR
ncbi:MAG: lytic murein transglycosylase [Thermoleophilaceae bacterium]